MSARSQSCAMWTIRAGCGSGSFIVRITTFVALLTTCALVRNLFLPIRNPVPDPPEGWPAFHGSR